MIVKQVSPVGNFLIEGKEYRECYFDIFLNRVPRNSLNSKYE